MSKQNTIIKETSFILDEKTPFQIQEAYKNLRTNVQYSLPAGGCKLIGVTSPERGEGKSTTTVNLAISFAQLGKKVVIVDGDMRLPTVARKLNIPGTPGLSNYIIGECELQDVCKLNTENNMYVIGSGNIPPEPTWLLQSDRMKQLLQELREEMDYIFLDLPPVTIVSDAQMLSSVVDGYLLVVQNGDTSKKKIAEMLNSLTLVDAKILGFVNTRSDNGKGSRYYKAYRKSGYYAYGYGSTGSRSK